MTPSELAVFAARIRHAADMALATTVATEVGPDARRFAANTGRIGTKLYAGVGSNSNVSENGIDEEKDRAAIGEIDGTTGRTKSTPRACATRTP